MKKEIKKLTPKNKKAIFIGSVAIGISLATLIPIGVSIQANKIKNRKLLAKLEQSNKKINSNSKEIEEIKEKIEIWITKIIAGGANITAKIEEIKIEAEKIKSEGILSFMTLLERLQEKIDSETERIQDVLLKLAFEKSILKETLLELKTKIESAEIRINDTLLKAEIELEKQFKTAEDKLKPFIAKTIIQLGINKLRTDSLEKEVEEFKNQAKDLIAKSDSARKTRIFLLKGQRKQQILIEDLTKVVNDIATFALGNNEEIKNIQSQLDEIDANIESNKENFMKLMKTLEKEITKKLEAIHQVNGTQATYIFKIDRKILPMIERQLILLQNKLKIIATEQIDIGEAVGNTQGALLKFINELEKIQEILKIQETPIIEITDKLDALSKGEKQFMQFVSTPTKIYKEFLGVRFEERTPETEAEKRLSQWAIGLDKQ